ncbi:MAG: hypothetical protein SH850_19695 [Planctomycetaceae bacterium]|nr:hypothetical protein [Planctomycetaceae bacterium]
MEAGTFGAAKSSVLRADTYERRMTADPGWALEEAGQFFAGNSEVNRTLRHIAQRLDELNIPYAVCGGMALFAHGFRRFTEDVDILVTPQGLKQIHEQLVGRGYLPPFAPSKHLRDTETKVQIEFLTTGQYPGDGKPKPVAFPDPSVDVFIHEGMRYVSLKTLIELKLASGTTGQGRRKDLSDVQELIRVLNLPDHFARNLDPSVASAFTTLWQEIHAVARRFVMIWRNKWLTAEAKSISEMADVLQGAADLLRRMQADGVVLDPDGSTRDDYARLVTTDPGVAAKYGMEDERDLWGEPDPEQP